MDRGVLIHDEFFITGRMASQAFKRVSGIFSGSEVAHSNSQQDKKVDASPGNLGPHKPLELEHQRIRK